MKNYSMKTIDVARCYLTRQEVEEKIQQLFPNKTRVPLQVMGFPQITELCSPEMFLYLGIYWGLNRTNNRTYFYALFDASELFPEYQLCDEYRPVIKVTRKIGYFPDYNDTPNGFSKIEMGSYKRLTANKIEVDEYFTFSLLDIKANIVIAKSSMTHNPANYVFKNLSNAKENWITFETALGDNIGKLNKTFQLLCEFYFEENRKKSVLRR